MRILFNDEPMKCDDGLTVAALLEKLRQLKPERRWRLIKQILPREQWEHQQVSEGEPDPAVSGYRRGLRCTYC